MWLDFGLEFSNFENLVKRPPEAAPTYTEDFHSLIYATMLSNVSAYLGYQLTLNAGFLFERQVFKEETKKESTVFVRIYAATGGI
jgi:hypothetical protein